MSCEALRDMALDPGRIVIIFRPDTRTVRPLTASDVRASSWIERYCVQSQPSLDREIVEEHR